VGERRRAGNLKQPPSLEVFGLRRQSAVTVVLSAGDANRLSAGLRKAVSRFACHRTPKKPRSFLKRGSLELYSV